MSVPYLPKKSIEQLKALHTEDAIRERLRSGLNHSYLRDFVYGAVDGAVTTFAVVSGVAGAGLSSGIIIVLGVANLIGDGFSMAAGNYLGTRAEEDLKSMARKMEEEHIDVVPEGEREEVRQIFAAKGFAGQELERAVEIITSNRELWIETMLAEELGISAQKISPMRAAAATFSAFLAVGALPLIPFIAQWIFPGLVLNPFLVSSVLTGAAFFVVGALKGRFVCHSWIRSGLETLAVGGVAASLAYGVGMLLKALVS
jgi:VIT1/CCC1 family predicted Fe2+/Mn2+ transporter